MDISLPKYCPDCGLHNRLCECDAPDMGDFGEECPKCGEWSDGVDCWHCGNALESLDVEYILDMRDCA